MEMDNPTLISLLSNLSPKQWRDAVNNPESDIALIRDLTEIQEQNGNYIKAEIATNKKEEEAIFGY